MTRPDPVAAALERWDAETNPIEGPSEISMTGTIHAGDALAALLRATNPPAGAERATEPVYTDDTPLMLEYREADEPATPAVGLDGDKSVTGLLDDPPSRITAACELRVLATDDRMAEHQGVACLMGASAIEAYSATPAVGEDEAIRKWLDARDCVGTTEAMMDAGDDLAARVHALLADVARLQKELDGTTFREERYAEDAAGARLALEDARAETLKWVTDHAQLQGKLAAVRKVAENYNNVDFVGDGRIEMTTNPCAAEILNVLEGKP